MTNKEATKILRYLGQLGKDLPELTQLEWDLIFQFIEYFISTEIISEENDKVYESFNMNWLKVLETLSLLNKIKDEK